MQNILEKWLTESQYNYGYRRIRTRLSNAYAKDEKIVKIKHGNKTIRVNLEQYLIDDNHLPFELIILHPNTKKLYFVSEDDFEFIKRFIHLLGYRIDIYDVLQNNGYCWIGM